MAFGTPLNPEAASYYDDISGFIHGPAEFHNLSSFADFPFEQPRHPDPLTPFWAHLAVDLVTGMNLTEAVERMGVWNWTACDKMSMRVLEKKPVFESGLSSSNNTAGEDINLIQVRDVHNIYPPSFDLADYQ